MDASTLLLNNNNKKETCFRHIILLITVAKNPKMVPPICKVCRNAVKLEYKFHHCKLAELDNIIWAS